MLPAKGVVNLVDWSKYKTIGRIDSIRKVGGKKSDLERCYSISSPDLGAEQLAAAICTHWGTEKPSLGLDVRFDENGRTIRKDSAPQNLSLLKKIVLNLIRLDTTDKTKASLRMKRKGVAWNDDVRMGMWALHRYDV